MHPTRIEAPQPTTSKTASSADRTEGNEEFVSVIGLAGSEHEGGHLERVQRGSPIDLFQPVCELARFGPTSFDKKVKNL
jgi:hypothetical protein